MTQYEQKFRDILAEILQLDQAELDFGISHHESEA